MKILIVEDQNGPLETLEFAVRTVFSKYFSEFHYDTARCYEDAQRMIKIGYDIVFLDHRMPRSDPGDLEDKDFDAFSRRLENIGYGLVSSIKQKNLSAIVIGTSSLSQEELGRSAAPDFTMSKMYGEAEQDLDRILQDLQKK